MKVIPFFACTLLLMGILVTGCETSKPARTVNADSLKTALTAANDSAQVVWRAMAQADSGKLAAIGQLLAEAAARPASDALLLDTLTRLQARLATGGLTPETMQSARIDAYDATADSLVQRLPRLTTDPRVAAVDSVHNATLYQRIRYDRFASSYNGLLKTYPTELSQAGFRNLKPKLLFQLTQ